MSRVKISKNFYLDEYIPKALYLKYAHKPHLLLRMIDFRLVESDQMLRNMFGPMTINNWWDGLSRQWSGIRTPDSSYYSITSDHAWGRASDKIPHQVSAETIREYIKKENNHIPLKITVIEEKKNASQAEDLDWLHSAVSWHSSPGPNKLLIVHP